MYNTIQNMINEVTGTTQEERHSKQHREEQACKRRLEAMTKKRLKEQNRKEKVKIYTEECTNEHYTAK